MKRVITFVLTIAFIVGLSACSNKTSNEIIEVNYIVSFNTENGSIIRSQSVKENGQAVKPLNPTKDGYVFDNWYLNDEPFDFMSLITSDITLFAKWDIVNYSINYELNGGYITKNNPSEYTIESNDILLNNPLRDAYIFDGWYKESVFVNKVTTICKGSYGDFILYSKWIPEEYEINYNLNGGINVDDNPEKYNIETETIILHEPSKDGYLFAGWYVNPMFVGESVSEIKTGTYGDIELFAKWINE